VRRAAESLLDRAYHRYGFHCEGGVLRLDCWVDGCRSSVRRALHIPLLSPGGVNARGTPSSGPLAAIVPGTGNVAALGTGPAYPALYYGTGEPAVEGAFVRPPERGRARLISVSEKVLWVVDPAYGGRGLCSCAGRELTGDKTRFAFSAATHLPRNSWSRREKRSLNGLRGMVSESPGCYAFQLDGPGFSRLIVFEVRRLG